MEEYKALEMEVIEFEVDDVLAVAERSQDQYPDEQLTLA